MAAMEQRNATLPAPMQQSPEVQVVATEDVTRAEAIQQLPTLRSVTRIKPVKH